MGPLPLKEPVLAEIRRLIREKGDGGVLNLELKVGEEEIVDLKRLDTVIEGAEVESKEVKIRLDHLLEQHRDKLLERDRLSEALKARHCAYFESLASLHSQLEPWDATLTKDEEQTSFPAKLAKIQMHLEIRGAALTAQSARVDSLRYLHQLHELQSKVKSEISTKKLYAATLSLTELKNHLKQDRTENLCRALQQLNHWSDRNQTQLVGMVDEVFWKFVILGKSDGNQLGCLEIKGDAKEEIDELSKCMHLLGSHEFTSQTLVSFIEKEFIGPLLRESGSIEALYTPPKIELIKSTAENTKCLRSLSTVKSLHSLFEMILQIPHGLIPADLFEKHVVALLRDQVLSKAIPTSKPGLNLFSELATSVIELEEFVGKHFETSGQLSNYVGHAEQLYLDRKRDDLLSLARAILLDDSPGLILVQEQELQWQEVFNSPIKSIPNCPLELPLVFPRCQVPDTVPRLVSAMEACLLEASGGQRAYLATRNVVDLYLAMTPSRPSLDSNRLRGAAMLHNECFYLGHLLLSLGYRFRNLCEDWVPCYLDFFPPLLALAHKSLALPLARHQEEALRLLQDLGDGGFRDLDQPARAQQASDAISSVLELVDELADSWRPLLPPRLFEATVGGQVLSPVCQWVVDQILDLVDIGEKDSYQLQKIASKLSSKVDDLLPHTTAQAQVPAYIQLDNLSSSILTGSLANIKALHGSGAFRAAFSDKQLANLVLSLFGASPSRSEFVNRLLKSK